MDADTRRAVADHLRSVADWRRSRYNDDLRDPRNLRSAAGLGELAGFVQALDEGDERLARLRATAFVGDVFEPGQQTAYEIGRFHFHSQEATLDGFLTRIVELAEADLKEFGRFGGRQVPGDDPW